MICIFPDPYPDELLYSVCARYKDLMKYPNNLTATSDFFGTASSAVVDLPNKLEHLVSVLPPGHRYTVDEFIDNHTMLPFYTPFLPSERARKVRDEMHRVGENQIFERIGLNASRFARPSQLRCCPLCVEEDRRQFGETYWHRIHQLSGVDVCPHHAVFLEPTEAAFHNAHNHGVATSAESVLLPDLSHRGLNLSDSCHKVLLDIARNATWLLRWKGGKGGNDDLRERYYYQLLRMEIAYYNGNIRATKLASQFNEYFPAQLLEALHCKIENPQHNWLLRLLRSGLKGVSQLPIRHILLIRFLGFTTEKFFKSPKEYKPFGDGPWPCLNRAVDHFRQPIVMEHRVTDNLGRGKRGRPVATFSCECGFVYNRVGPDNSDADRYRVDSVESYGREWEQALSEAWLNISLSVEAAARQLGVSGLTVVRHAIRLDLPMNTPNARQVSTKTIERYKSFRRSRKDALEYYRNEWLSVLEANPSASRKQLIEVASFLYLWLRKYDSAWIESHLPLVKKGKRKAELKDWGRIDIELAAAVDAAALHIRELPSRPVRLTSTAIRREVGNRMWLEFRLHKLPLTAIALKSYLETDEQFLIRRVAWAEGYYSQKGICPTRSYFEARAGTKHKSGKMPAVQSAIDIALERLQARLSLASSSSQAAQT